MVSFSSFLVAGKHRKARKHKKKGDFPRGRRSIFFLFGKRSDEKKVEQKRETSFERDEKRNEFSFVETDAGERNTAVQQTTKHEFRKKKIVTHAREIK